uniref:RAN binding protein 10 n=1 Tax=Ursus americanus TaxID=9643 RepID=A0A452S514_URSAM
MAAATADPGAGSPQAGDSSGGGAGGGLPSPGEQELSRRLQRLYPAVNQHETPLPRSWSPKDKYNYIGLSQGNLRVHYKGIGLTWESLTWIHVVCTLL